jgi:hypothetical protein
VASAIMRSLLETIIDKRGIAIAPETALESTDLGR